MSFENFIVLFLLCPDGQVTYDSRGVYDCFYGGKYLFLDAIASPSSYPCQWVSEWVSQWLIVSDLEIAIASPSFASLLFCLFVGFFVVSRSSNIGRLRRKCWRSAAIKWVNRKSGKPSFLTFWWSGQRQNMCNKFSLMNFCLEISRGKREHWGWWGRGGIG